jgi:hypothetical protein
VLVAAVARYVAAVRFPVVSGLCPDHDVFGIVLRRKEVLLFIVPRPQGERGIVVEIDTLAFGETELLQGYDEFDS